MPSTLIMSLERCRAEIERLSCEMSRTFAERDQSSAVVVSQIMIKPECRMT